nr:hypothetical protein [Tanacetum cinerariifolium]
MPYFYQTHWRKKSKTSETTLGSASGGLSLNEEADEAVEETQEFRLMGRDRAKAKKKAAGSSRGGSSFVDLVADKFYKHETKKMGKEGRATTNYACDSPLSLRSILGDDDIVALARQHYACGVCSHGRIVVSVVVDHCASLKLCFSNSVTGTNYVCDSSFSLRFILGDDDIVAFGGAPLRTWCLQP